MNISSLLMLLLLLASPVLADEFIVTAESAVADLASGLVWQGSSAPVVSGFAATDYCSQLNAGGPYLWRLPSRAELSNLDTRLEAVAPSVYWVAADTLQQEGLYCFGDGAYFPSAKSHPAALVRCVSADPLAPVVEALNVWLESWNNGDVEVYLSSYVGNFRPPSAIDHQVWEQQRRRRLSSAVGVSIKLKTEEINPLNDQVVEVVFLQDYRSRHYQDRVRKRLLLKQEQGRWLIAKEEQLSTLPQQVLSASTTYYR